MRLTTSFKTVFFTQPVSNIYEQNYTFRGRRWHIYRGTLQTGHPIIRFLAPSPLLPPHCQTHYLFTMRTVSRHLVARADRCDGGHAQGPTLFLCRGRGQKHRNLDIKRARFLRTFASILPEGEGVKKQMAWPALKWSPDDKYTARLTLGQQISVYELPSMGLERERSLKIEGVVDFEWYPHGEKEHEDATKASKQPIENMLAY